MKRIAINGFGRIGRVLILSLIKHAEQLSMEDFDIVAINTGGNFETYLHLLNYDSVHGKLDPEAKLIKEGNDTYMSFGVSGKLFKPLLVNERAIENLPWDEIGVDLVLECTGAFRKREDVIKHINAGAKKVLVSAPCGGVDKTIVYGVNHDKLLDDDLLVSAASCTTNCVVPAIDTINKNLGLEQCYINTVHAYTGDQVLLDKAHKDLRRGRAANMSIIPTTTGAAKATEQVLPELKGKISGMAIRVPTPNVSMADLYINLSKQSNTDEINSIFQASSKTSKLTGVLTVNQLPLVSIDFNQNSASCVFDSTQTSMIDDKFLHVSLWYDNEWGFCCRMWNISKLMTE